MPSNRSDREVQHRPFRSPPTWNWTLRAINHESIIKLVDVFEDDEHAPRCDRQVHRRRALWQDHPVPHQPGMPSQRHQGTFSSNPSKLWSSSTSACHECTTRHAKEPCAMQSVLTTTWARKSWMDVIIRVVIFGASVSLPASYSSTRIGNLMFERKEWRCLNIMSRDFVRRLLFKDASLQSTVEEALQHPWILSHC